MTEYAIVFSVVAAAIIGMQLFVKRGLQAKEKDVTEYLALQNGGVAGIKALKQYEPYYTAAGTYTTETTNAPYTEKMLEGGTIQRTGISDKTTRTTDVDGITQSADLSKDDNWKN